LTEEELILELRLKNEPAFRWLVNHYHNRVYNTVLNILQSTEDAEDAAQETFIQVYESIAKFKAECSLATWIYRIAVRKALDKIRKRKLRKSLHGILPWWMPGEKKKDEAGFTHPGILAENKEKATVLFKAMARLPDKQQLAFTLIKVQGMKYEEVCGIMQQSTKAVESLVSRARVNLQKELEHYYNILKKG
jgi:RNA polymerase sigma factor (sigma-70 family)